ncbi:MAG: thiamine pyrophosphate-requiring protein [Chloroflexi bacterium]|nr:thiamine pyrophosphate-requiring protein [Chloroflexota bacterium]
MKANTAIARILKREGVEYLFCYPSNTLIEACAVEGIRPILARTERTVLSMADGYTRMHNGRKIGVCCFQRASGSENMFGGVAQVFSDNTPILVLPGGNPRTQHGVPYSFEAKDHYRNTTKWVESINLVERLPSMMRRAFSQLRNGRLGPVMLDTPMDVTREDVDDAAVEAYVPPKRFVSQADPAGVAQAVELLLAAERPVLFAGQGVLYAEAWDDLRELAELLQIPVAATMNAKSVFPEDHPLSLGTAGAACTELSDTFLNGADLIFGVGASFSANTYSYPMPQGKQIVQVTTDERDLNKDLPTDLGLIGDARLVLRQLIEAASAKLRGKGRDGSAVQAEIAKVKAASLEKWLPRLTSDSEPISPYRVIHEMNRVLDRKNAIVTHDAGNPRDQILPFYEAVTPRGYLGWGKSTHLGWGLGLAMGAKLAAPDKLAINFMGDAAFGMVGMEIETAARERIGLLTILINNQGMAGYPNGYPTAVQQFGFANLTGQYARMAETLGGYGERVEKVSEVGPALQRGAQIAMEGRPALLEIMTRPDTVISRSSRR